MVKGFSDMSPAEIEQVQRWTKAGMTPNAIAELQGRDPGTVNKYIMPANGTQKAAKKTALTCEFRARLVKINKSRSFARTRVEVKKIHLKKKQEQKEDIHALHKKRGRPPMTAADYKTCERAAKGEEEEVTAAMVLKEANVDYSEQCLRKHFKLHGKPFRKLREKPLLTPEDVEVRMKFVRKHGGKTRKSWRSRPHAIIDNKRYQMFLNYVARRTCRGAYRDGKDAVRSDLVKPKKTLKCAVSGILIAAAVVKDKIRMWHVIEGRWTGKKAAQMYEGPC